MKQEQTFSARTIAAAKQQAVEYFGVPEDKLQIEVLAEPKKGFLGFGEAPAKILVTYEKTAADLAVDFVRTVLKDMEIEGGVSVTDTDVGKRIDVTGEDSTILIGHHGETLDQLQYLVNLVANRREEDASGREYTKITLDIEGYRARREETLRSLARRMASKALRTNRNVSLEPMNAYERRIIHSEVQNITGVTTASVGAENNRHVVIYVKNGED